MNDARIRISLCFLFFILASSCKAQREIPLYPGNIPNAKGLPLNKTNAGQTAFTRVAEPALRLYLHAKDSVLRTAVIICAGGGYANVNITREGYRVAEAFNKSGIAAIVLRYRLPDDQTNINKSIAPLQDAQQAIRTVRDSASSWGIDPARIGIMGFSAGGHLASSLGVHYRDELIDNPGKTNLRPDFMILVYPVISFSDAIGHKGSRDNLLGKTPSADTVRYFSNEWHVTSETPPAFLTHPTNDKVVPVQNSLRFYEALLEKGVSAEMHIYSKGGHGYGTTPPFDEWFGRCLFWMRTANWIR
jgi:acetyl esterase/lipase